MYNTTKSCDNQPSEIFQRCHMLDNITTAVATRDAKILKRCDASNALQIGLYSVSTAELHSTCAQSELTQSCQQFHPIRNPYQVPIEVQIVSDV